MKLVLFTILVAVVSYNLAGNKFAGPFNIQVKQPFVCEDEGAKEIYFNQTTVRKKSKNLYAITSKIFLIKPFDDNLTMKVNFAVWGNGGWRPNFMNMEYKNACTNFKTLLPGIYNDILQTNNLTGCPLPTGMYDIIDADASPQVGLASLPYNKYKIYVTFATEDGDTLGCLGMITHIVPKDKKG